MSFEVAMLMLETRQAPGPFSTGIPFTGTKPRRPRLMLRRRAPADIHSVRLL